MSQTPRPSPHRAEVFSARARLGLVNRKAVDASDEDKDNARRDLTAANIKAYIAEKVAEAPPLSIAQRESIISLLRAGGESRMIDTKPVVSQQGRDALEDRGLLPMQGYKSP